MIDIISKVTADVAGSVVGQLSTMIRREVDYAASTVKASIETGIRESFAAVRPLIFYLFIALGCTMVGLVFIIWGAARMFESIFSEQPGMGFLVFGVLVMLVGLISFSMSKPK